MVGRYEQRALRGTRATRDPGAGRGDGGEPGTLVAPHFTLGQFVSKQPGGYPKYLVLRERLLLKLEMLLEEASRLGIPAHTFRILSGYRTPVLQPLDRQRDPLQPPRVRRRRRHLRGRGRRRDHG